MTRKTNRRTNLTLESLEGRHLQSGLASPQADMGHILPYIEQDNVYRSFDPGRPPRGGGENNIIAILIG